MCFVQHAHGLAAAVILFIPREGSLRGLGVERVLDLLSLCGFRGKVVGLRAKAFATFKGLALLPSASRQICIRRRR